MIYQYPIFDIPRDVYEDYSAANEATVDGHINLQFEEEFTLRDKYFVKVESFLPKTEKLLFRHIAKYEDKYGYILNTPYLTKILPFGNNEKGEDYDIVFRCVNIDQEELRADIKKVPLPGNLTEKAAFLPFQVTMFLIARYYIITNQKNKLEALYGYYGYSIYWKRFTKSFPNGVDPQIMLYTINNLSYHSLIKKLGSLKALLVNVVRSKFEYYREGIANSCDEEIRYILDQIQSDIGSKVNKIASAYYHNHDNKNRIYIGTSNLDDTGVQRLDTSTTASVETYAQKYTSKFFMENINSARVKQAATLAKDVSVKELEATLHYVHEEVTTDQLHDFYTSMFYIYLTLDDPRATVESIRSLKFLALMKDVIKKGNSTDKNIVKTRAYMDEWLMKGSNTFRLTTREGTQTSYRKAVFFYFILLVTNN